ncbi:protein odr-4 homolog [Petromyzon marinus]|uniref:protein odr-4 homolog n=1 Tax=Petromyzon marinus TaxID=7757 RepID=UPI003F6E9AFB
MAQTARLFVAEEAAERALSSAAATAPAEGRTGLLLGLAGNSSASSASSLSNRDVVLLAVPTPARDDDEEEEEEEDGERAGEAWAAEHARLVRRMLPGGIAILGVFLAFPGGHGGDTEKRQAKLRRLLFGMERALARGRPPQGRGGDDDEDDDDDNDGEADVKHRAALLAVGPSGRRWCSSYDVRDAQAAASRAEWRLRPKPPQHQQQQQQQGATPLLVELRCTLHLELRAPLSPPGGRGGGASAAGALRAATRQLAGQLRRAVCLVDGRFLRDDEAIGPADGGGGGGGGGGRRRRLKQQQQRPCPPIAVRILLPPPGAAAGAAAPGAGGPCPHGLLQIVGSASCRALVNPQRRPLLAGPALRALKADAVASLWTRFELLLEEEELVGAGREAAAVATALPRRVFVPVPGLWGARLCHFAFPDETAADCAARVGEVLGLDLGLAGAEEVEEAEEVVAMVVEEEEKAPGPIVTADGADGDGSGGACGPEAMRRRRRKEEEEEDGRGGVRGEVGIAGRLCRSPPWLVVGAGVAVVAVVLLLLLYAAVAD